jgi:hypothetical protein
LEDDFLSASEQEHTQKVVQYLREAHATELGLTRVPQSQIAVAPLKNARRRRAVGGHDELKAAEIQAALQAGADECAKQVQSYERAHKDRAGAFRDAEREHANA